MANTKTSATRQLTIFPRGGARAGAGRKPKGANALVAHVTRSKVTGRDPVLITTRLVDGLPSLRRGTTLVLLRDALAAGADQFGFRLVEFSVQTNQCVQKGRRVQ